MCMDSCCRDSWFVGRLRVLRRVLRSATAHVCNPVEHDLELRWKLLLARARNHQKSTIRRNVVGRPPGYEARHDEVSLEEDARRWPSRITRARGAVIERSAIAARILHDGFRSDPISFSRRCASIDERPVTTGPDSGLADGSCEGTKAAEVIVRMVQFQDDNTGQRRSALHSNAAPIGLTPASRSSGTEAPTRTWCRRHIA